MLKDISHIYATRGKKVVHLDLKNDNPDAKTLSSLLIGPSGNLRAPALRKRRTLIVGFDRDIYDAVIL